jgi:hypothetical protein
MHNYLSKPGPSLTCKLEATTSCAATEHIVARGPRLELTTGLCEDKNVLEY